MKLVLLGILLVTSVMAQILVPVQSAWAAESHGHEGVHKHHVSVFAGNTTDYKGHNAFTLGADYEYRFNKRWGLVGLVDHATGEIDATVVAAGVMLHALKDLRLQAAPGVDVHHDEGQLVVRFGVLYDFHVGGWTFSPCVYVDVLELDKNHIYGLGFGKGF